MRRLRIPLLLFFGGCILESAEPQKSIDPDQPYRIELGRGSGWHGLNTIRITEDGTATLFRLVTEHRKASIHQYTETTEVELPADVVVEILAAVDESGVMELDRQYHAEVHDGTQWVLLVQQGDWEKSVYCNNRFPKPMVRFAESLDAILDPNGVSMAKGNWREWGDRQSQSDTNGVRHLRWKRVPDPGGRNHENELWDSIER
jgi:hypothetical protein